MKISNAVRTGAVVSSLALVGLAASPALAATPVAQATATGANVVIAAQPASTGSYAVTNDGVTQTSTGSNRAALPVLGGQNAVRFGTIAQDATTSIVNGDGRSAACAGAAGNGASLASAGSGTSCLTGGDNVNISAGTLNLSGITLVDNPALAGLNAQVSSIVAPVGAALNTATTQLLGALGNPSVVLSLGALQSSCTATPTTADGTANLANAGAFVNLPAFAGQPAQRIDLINFPANPAPNTAVVTDLDAVVNTIINALRTSLNTTAQGQLAPLQGALGPLGVTLDTLQQQLVTGVIGQVSNQLAPLQDNILSGTLNKQVRPQANSIEVTALELQLLPAARQQLGAAALELMIGKSTCGPNARVAAPSVAPTTAAPANPSNPSRPDRPEGTPRVPTSVPAGLADADPAPLGPLALGGLGALLAASVATGAVVYRRNARI